MQDKYESPILEITRFATEDIITTSSTPNRPSGNDSQGTETGSGSSSSSGSSSGSSSSSGSGSTLGGGTSGEGAGSNVHTACYQDEQGRWFNGTESDCTREDLKCTPDQDLFGENGSFYCDYWKE